MNHTACICKLRSKIDELEKKIYEHNKQRDVDSGFFQYVKEKCLAASRAREGIEHKYKTSLETSQSPEKTACVRADHLQAMHKNDEYKDKWMKVYKAEYAKIFPHSLVLDGMHEEVTQLRQKIATLVQQLNAADKTSVEDDREQRVHAMAAWHAEKARQVATMIPDLGRADHRRNGTLEVFHRERADRERVEQQHKRLNEKIQQDSIQERIQQNRARLNQQAMMHPEILHQPALLQPAFPQHGGHGGTVPQHVMHHHPPPIAALYAPTFPHMPYLPGTYGPQW